MTGFDANHDRMRRIYAGRKRQTGARAAFAELRAYTAHLLELPAESAPERRTAEVVQLPLKRHSGA